MMVESKWQQDASCTQTLVNIFVENVDPHYISYGEVLCDRATNAEEWSSDLGEVLRVEIGGILTGNTNSKIACAYIDSQIVGFSIVNINKDAKTPYAFLEDIVVKSEHRNCGIGKALTNFVEEELRKDGIKQVYLESGINNHLAHTFFEKRGYSLMAKVMSKVL